MFAAEVSVFPSELYILHCPFCDCQWLNGLVEMKSAKREFFTNLGLLKYSTERHGAIASLYGHPDIRVTHNCGLAQSNFLKALTEGGHAVR